jgi:hypothetical protein
VAFPDGLIIQLQDVTGLKYLRSENPALLDWVHELMKYVRTQEKQTRAMRFWTMSFFALCFPCGVR